MRHKLLLCLTIFALTAGCVANDRRTEPLLHEIPDVAAVSQVSDKIDTQRTLTVITLNTAHGRSDGLHQLLTPASRHRRNLDRISAVLAREKPHVVALQEADGPSLWSGRFNHVDYLAKQAGIRYYVQGVHSGVPGLSYGTALLSITPLQNRLSVDFRPAFAAFPKGFVISTIGWPAQRGLQIDVVSVHLNPTKPRLRKRQIDELIDVIEHRDRPLILMGDFNSDWNGRRKILHKLTEELGLSTFQPEAKNLATYSSSRRRLDWIFVSPEFSIESYETLPDRISDHRAVVAKIALRPVGGRITMAN